ncbi:mitochondrial glycoprotein [Lanmaoa asiatica]|nr:mitochondrial glycoprotein [Lanmaoa asiatica]
MSAFRTLRQLTSVSSRIVTASGTAEWTDAVSFWSGCPSHGTVDDESVFHDLLSFLRGCLYVRTLSFHKSWPRSSKYEKESASTEEPEFLKAFKEQGIWTIEDVQGNDEVTLTRKFGNENIRVMFSIADIQNMEEESEFDQDSEESGEEEHTQSYPIRVSFSVVKDRSTLTRCVKKGAFLVDNISFYPDAKLGTELTAEADWKRRGLYIGPQFDTLDVAVQEEFEKWLNERGVNENLATFIPEYSEHKEQKEYVRWLDNVKNFIDA